MGSHCWKEWIHHTDSNVTAWATFLISLPNRCPSLASVIWVFKTLWSTWIPSLPFAYSCPPLQPPFSHSSLQFSVARDALQMEMSAHGISGVTFSTYTSICSLPPFIFRHIRRASLTQSIPACLPVPSYLFSTVPYGQWTPHQQNLLTLLQPREHGIVCCTKDIGNVFFN